jgi:hypothetical protein
MKTVLPVFASLLFFPVHTAICQNRIWAITAIGDNHDYGTGFTTHPEEFPHRIIHTFDRVNGS